MNYKNTFLAMLLAVAFVCNASAAKKEDTKWFSNFVNKHVTRANAQKKYKEASAFVRKHVTKANAQKKLDEAIAFVRKYPVHTILGLQSMVLRSVWKSKNRDAIRLAELSKENEREIYAHQGTKIQLNSAQQGLIAIGNDCANINGRFSMLENECDRLRMEANELRAVLQQRTCDLASKEESLRSCQTLFKHKIGSFIQGLRDAYPRDRGLNEILTALASQNGLYNY